MESKEINDIRKKLKKRLDKERFEHTIGVMYTAGCLAMAYKYPIEKAMLAGLLHDCAKCISNEEKLDICQTHNIPVSLAEMENKSLLHAKAGAVLAKEEYDIEDADIHHAITVHTTGEPDMNLLDKIVYVADYIEPGRDKAPNLEYIRMLAYQNIDKCIAQILYDTLNFLDSKRGAIDPTTQLTYEFYRQYKED